MSNEQAREMVQYLERNASIAHVSIPAHQQGATLHYQLKRTLQRNKTLKNLQIKFHPHLISVLAPLMKSNTCSLEYLCLDELGPGRPQLAGLPDFLRSLFRNTTLRGLRLNFECRASLVTLKFWDTFLELIRHNTHLKELVLSLSYDSDDTPINADDLAIALNVNTTLTSVQVLHNGRPRPLLDFCCRLYTRRNRIQQMVKEKLVRDSLWPVVLEALTPNPSALFLTMRYLPWPADSGR